MKYLGLDVLALLADERLVDVGDDAAPGDGGLDQGVQLLVSTDGELREMRIFTVIKQSCPHEYAIIWYLITF